MSIDHALFVISTLLVLSVVASKSSGRLGVPALLIFLAIGMLAGSEGPGKIRFQSPFLAQSLGVVALIYIIFAGGLDTEWRSIRFVIAEGVLLSTLGVIATALVTGLFASLVIGLTLSEGLLLGAIVASTDTAAVFTVLKDKNVLLRGRIKRILELESGSNDPVAVLLTIVMTHLITRQSGAGIGIVLLFFQQLIIGFVIGLLAGRFMVFIINRIRLTHEGLYTVLTLSLVMFTYSFAASLNGSGFLAVYVAGLVMGNSSFIYKRGLMKFHDGIAWLMQILMFVTLGLLVRPSSLLKVMWGGLAVSLFLMLVARPAGVFGTLAFSRLRFAEKLMISWVGLRGAVPIVLATFPLLAGVPNAPLIFDLVFFIVITSVLLQGTTIPFVARLLGVDEPAAGAYKPAIQMEQTEHTNADLVDIIVPDNSKIVGKRLHEMNLPKGAIVMLIVRDGDKYVIPDGGTVIQPRDRLHIFADKNAIDALHETIDPDI